MKPKAAEAARPRLTADLRRMRRRKLRQRRIVREFETCQAVAQAGGLIACDAWYVRHKGRRELSFPM